MSSPIVPPPPRSASSLADAMVQTTNQAQVLRRWGIVKAINGNGTVNVDIAGVTIPNLKRVASYEPSVNERVLIDAVGTDLTVIGATAPSPRAYNRPTGDIEPTLRKTAKPDTLLLQGQTVKRSDYPRLFQWASDQGLLATATVANLFGRGDGTTTFTLPDFRGRTVVGADATNVLGALFGNNSVTLAENQMPAHKHDVAVANHAAHSHSGNSGAAGGHGHPFSGGVTGGGGGHAHGLISMRYSTPGNPHDHYNVVGTVSEGTSGAGTGPGGNAGTAGVGDHTHGFGGNTNTVANHSHTIPAEAAMAHTVTETAKGGTTAVDVRQPSFAINWMIWI